MNDESITIILPLPNKILSPNCPIYSLRGRYAKAAAVKKQRRLAREAVESARVESRPWERVRVDSRFFHTTNRRRDSDNADLSLKAARDGVVDAELATDDDPKHMCRSEPTFHVDKRYPRVELTITNISDTG